MAQLCTPSIGRATARSTHRNRLSRPAKSGIVYSSSSPLHAHPIGFVHVSLREMHESPHALLSFSLHAWAKDQKLGGVGLYPSSGFIHMDTGPIRFWSGE
jgi:hypothetical protein